MLLINVFSMCISKQANNGVQYLNNCDVTESCQIKGSAQLQLGESHFVKSFNMEPTFDVDRDVILSRWNPDYDLRPLMDLSSPEWLPFNVLGLIHFSCRVIFMLPLPMQSCIEVRNSHISDVS